jgi:hypothetical protein
MRAKPAIALAVLCVLCQPAVAKPTYQTVDVPGETYTELAAINDAGIIAGTVIDTTAHGVIRATDGSFTIFDPPGSTGTTVLGMNQAGDVVGYFQTQTDSSLCFIRSAAGLFTIFGPTKGSNLVCIAAAINDKADMAGDAAKGPYEYAFLRTASAHTRHFLEVKHAVTSANGINNAKTVAGSTPGGSFRAGFLRTKDGGITLFDAPGDADGTEVSGINDKGTIAGTFADSAGNNHGYVRAADGAITEFDVPGAIETQTAAINAKGAITGTYSVTGKSKGGFVRSANGNIARFAPEGFASTFPASLNAGGVIVGNYLDGQSILHGFIRTP